MTTFKKLLFLLVFLFLILPKNAQAQTKTFYSYDLNFSFENDQGYEEALFVTALQGIVNRTGPRLYVYRESMPWLEQPLAVSPIVGSPSIDLYWLRKFQESGRWLNGYTEQKITSIEQLLNIFKDEILKVTVWDGRVDATANAATTIAGVENAPPVIYDGVLYNKLVVNGINIGGTIRRYPVAVNLYSKNFTDISRIPESTTATTGSAKNNVYIWALEKYINTGKVNPLIAGSLEDAYGRRLLGYTETAQHVTPRDLLVMKRGFVFDLSPLADEAPIDDRTQTVGLDLATLRKIMQALRNRVANNEMIEVIGFIPWFDKYCDHRDTSSNYECSQTEYWLTRNISQYNGGLVAIDHIDGNDLSFHSHAPKYDRYIQNPPPLPKTTENKTYLLFIVGDYDPVSWHKFMIPWSWDLDPARGQIPLAWGVNPYPDYYPDIIDHLYRTKTSNDYFIGHASGCLYVHPDYLANFPAYAKKCLPLYRQRNYSITGWALEGNEKASTRDLNFLNSFYSFSGDGLGVHCAKYGECRRWFADYIWAPSVYQEGMPVLQVIDTYKDSTQMAKEHILYMLEQNSFLTGLGTRPNFLSVRIGGVNPTFFLELYNRLRADRPAYNFTAVDPYTFYYLSRSVLETHPDKRAQLNFYRTTYMADTIPTTMTAGTQYTVSTTIRNDGWDTWVNAEPTGKIYYLIKSIVPFGQEHTAATYDAQGRILLPQSIPPGGQVTISYTITAPSTAGKYSLQLDMLREQITGFRSQGDIPWEKTINVCPSTIPPLGTVNCASNFQTGSFNLSWPTPAVPTGFVMSRYITKFWDFGTDPADYTNNYPTPGPWQRYLCVDHAVSGTASSFSVPNTTGSWGSMSWPTPGAWPGRCDYRVDFVDTHTPPYRPLYGAGTYNGSMEYKIKGNWTEASECSSPVKPFQCIYPSPTPTRVPTPTPTFVPCQTCPTTVPAKSLGNANCDGKVNAIDFSMWRKVYTALGIVPETEKAAVNFNCLDSDISHIVNLLDFKIWAGNYR